MLAHHRRALAAAKATAPRTPADAAAAHERYSLEHFVRGSGAGAHVRARLLKNPLLLARADRHARRLRRILSAALLPVLRPRDAERVWEAALDHACAAEARRSRHALCGRV